MSVEAINWALRQVTDEPVDKLILICLANYAGDDHSSFPSRKKLAEVGMCSVDTVDRANKRLEARGLISKSERLHARGGKASNCYTLNVDEVAARCGHVQPPAVVAARVPPPQPHDAPRVAASGRGQGSRTRCGYKEPSKEPSKEISPQPPKGGASPLDALRAFEAFNAMALRCGIPQASKMSPDRQRKIIARLKDYGEEGWTQALANIEKSSFLTGSNDRGWRLTLDFLLKPEGFGKVHDGGYGNGRHTGSGGGEKTFEWDFKPETDAEMFARIQAEQEALRQ
jgi:DNA-binding transcriptional MocR family regulator